MGFHSMRAWPRKGPITGGASPSTLPQGSRQECGAGGQEPVCLGEDSCPPEPLVHSESDQHAMARPSRAKAWNLGPGRGSSLSLPGEPKGHPSVLFQQQQKLSLASGVYVTLGRLLLFSGPQFTHL